MSGQPLGIRLVVHDWAGTVIDFGSCAPVAAFVAVFAARGITVSDAEARAPMGRHKKDHLLAMLRQPAITARWRQRLGRAWTDTDVEAMYQELVPLQLATVEQHAALVPGVHECATALRRRGIRLAGTTGYFRAAADLCLEAARAQGYEPDGNACGDDVPAGRPAPWMIFRLMEQLSIYPPAAVVKVGDTLVDIEEGRNAGVWSVAITSSSSEMGLPLQEYRALREDDRRARLALLTERFHAAGAHAVIETLHELPALVARLDACLAQGERP